MGRPPDGQDHAASLTAGPTGGSRSPAFCRVAILDFKEIRACRYLDRYRKCRRRLGPPERRCYGKPAWEGTAAAATLIDPEPLGRAHRRLGTAPLMSGRTALTTT